MPTEVKKDMGCIENNDDPAPVFIVGGSRTGSEMLKTMLSASPALDFVDEMFLHCPRWLHQDLASNLQARFGSLDSSTPTDELIDFLYSGKPYGWFWSNTMLEIDKGQFENELMGVERNMRGLFLAIMRAHSKHNGKQGLGAKFPLHYSCVGKLLEWFPECRIIHTTRNPQAVYASQSAKYISKDESTLSKTWTRFQHFVHINIQTSWTAKVHRSLAGSKNYMLVRYEDIVLNPKTELESICNFLETPYLEEMLKPKQYGSSFDAIAGSHGVSNSSLERWKTSVSPGVQWLNKHLHPKAYKWLGYATEYPESGR